MNKKIASALVGFGLGLASLVSVNVSAGDQAHCLQQYNVCTDKGYSHYSCYSQYVQCLNFQMP